MASHDAMNREDGDADHVAVTQSDMTRATSAALQGSAGQRPSSGGSVEMSAEASPQHHPESENTSVGDRDFHSSLGSYPPGSYSDFSYSLVRVLTLGSPIQPN